MKPIKVRIREDSVLRVGVRDEKASVTVHGELIGTALPLYEGPYEATPTQSEQTFQTGNKAMEQNFVVRPIPNNYGLITYNGYELTVS